MYLARSSVTVGLGCYTVPVNLFSVSRRTMPFCGIKVIWVVSFIFFWHLYLVLQNFLDTEVRLWSDIPVIRSFLFVKTRSRGVFDGFVILVGFHYFFAFARLSLDCVLVCLFLVHYFLRFLSLSSPWI